MTLVLIANRGEVAARIARTVRDLGHTALGVFAQDEADAPYLAAMDRAAALPGTGPAAFLDFPALIAAARATGATMLHPGWGFGAESPTLARACAEAGITFVGPDAATLALMGDKTQARALALSSGVPTAQAATDAAGAAELLRTGPILLKAASGGGGRGMRVVTTAAALAPAWAEATAEAEKFFGDGTIFAERLIEHARHIEVQIAGDGTNAISLGTRDCTLQRRHQKLVETAPAAAPPGLEDAALRMARAAAYRGLGTWEFLVASTDFVFLEVNPRLQVEHTVTEMVTGLDLVALQLRLAAGETLAAIGLATPPAPRGHAIQLRLNAETIAFGGTIRPAGGTLLRFRPPTGPGLRCDHAAAEGMDISTAYDSLLAKLIVHAPDRAACLRRARRALAESTIEGVATSLPLLSALLARPEVEADTIDTRLLERILPDLLPPAEDLPVTDTDAIAAPMPGTLVLLSVEPGADIAAGTPIALIEAMKMQMEVRAPRAGRVLRLVATPGRTLREGETILLLALGGAAADTKTTDAIDLDHIRPDLGAFMARRDTTLDAARPDAAARRHAAGKRTARENLAHLFDDGDYAEYGALAVAAQRRRRPLDELIRISPADGLICGIGTVEKRPTAAMAYDYTVMAGTQGFLNHKKTDRLLGIVHKDKLPLVLYAEGGGGRPGDTDVMGVAGLDLSTFGAFAALSGKASLIAIASGYCFAGNAALLGCCDIVIATQDSSIGMGGPAMIEGGGLGVVRPQDVGPIDVQTANGVVDLAVADEAEATTAARACLAYLSGATTDFSHADQRALRHAVPEDRKRIYDMRALITSLADSNSVLELRPHFGRGIVTALIRLGGRPMGLIANDPRHLGGAIDAPAADKAARFLQLCDAHGLPILSLCDTPGFMVGPDTERTAQVRHVCRMFVTGAALSVPVFCVVTRKGYGLGAMAMAAGGFHAPRFTIAWPSGEFGGMGLEGAVRLGYKRELEAEQDPAARQALFEKLVGRLYTEGHALNMASYLEIDAVIDPADTRQWLQRALTTTPVRRGTRYIDTW